MTEQRIARQREHNIDLIEQRCRHFRGFQYDTCNAGLRYAELNGGTNFDLLHNLPCNRDGWNGSHSCEQAVYPSRDEAITEEEESQAQINAYVKKLAEQICPKCDEHWQGRQVGPCVYCEHCGYRLYQGKVPK